MLQGSIVAIVTPFYEDGSVNYKKFVELLEYHLENKTDGIVILGTTGEATTLTQKEAEELISISVKTIQHRVPLIVGAGSNDTHQAVFLAKRYSQLGADYILSITPYYNKTNEQGVIQHFISIAEASSCPILLYNVPSRTGMNISISAIEVLAKHPNIYGIKEASGNMSYAVEVSCFLSDSFIMLSGNDDIIVPMMSIGAKGVISVLANICPREVHELCNFCLKNEYLEAVKLQKKLFPLAHGLFLETNPIPVKEALNFWGFKVGGYRLPLYSMSEPAKNKLIAAMKKYEEEIR